MEGLSLHIGVSYTEATVSWLASKLQNLFWSHNILSELSHRKFMTAI